MRNLKLPPLQEKSSVGDRKRVRRDPFSAGKIPIAPIRQWQLQANINLLTTMPGANDFGLQKMNQREILVRKPADLTLRWAQKILGHHFPDASATKIRILSVNLGTTTRVRLAVEHDAPGTFPRKWFVKMPSALFKPRLITALPRLLETEVRFYSQAKASLPVDHPFLLAAGKRFGRGTTLVLGDVSETG
ncbi:MAG: hypothetical protein ACOC0U_00815, partial [Desulfovibrionales bacterium]